MSYLKKIRREKQLTQKEAAKKLGFSYSHVVKIENGFKHPSYDFLLAVKKEFRDKADMNKFFE